MIRAPEIFQDSRKIQRVLGLYKLVPDQFNGKEFVSDPRREEFNVALNTHLCGVPVRFLDHTHEGYPRETDAEVRAHLQQCDEQLPTTIGTHSYRELFLTGTTGVGKSGLASVVVKNALMRDIPACVVRLSHIVDLLFNLVKTGFDRQQESEELLETYLTWPKLLVLDEVDKVRPMTDFDTYVVPKVNEFFTRISDDLPALILISNKSLEDITLPDNIKDRAYASTQLVFTGPSLRPLVGQALAHKIVV